MITPEEIKQLREKYNLGGSIIPSKEERKTNWESMGGTPGLGSIKEPMVMEETTQPAISGGKETVFGSIEGGEGEIPRARVSPTETDISTLLGKYAVNIPLSAVDAAYGPTKTIIKNTIDSASAIMDIIKTSPTAGSALKSTLGGFKETLSNIYTKTGESVYNYLEKKAKENMPERDKSMSSGQFAGQFAANVLSDVTGDIAGGVAKSVIEDPFWWLVGATESKTVQQFAGRTSKAVEGLAIKAEGIAQEGISKVTGLAETGLQKAKTTLFGEGLKVSSIDDVVKQADKALSTSAIKGITEQATSKPSVMERWAGISPDVKNRISGKQELLKEYFDVAHSRNNFDTLPTVMEHATKYTDDAVTKMEKLLNETGGEIGSFRKKISTYEANIDQVTKIESSFNSELSKLNLEVKNGQVVQKAGTVKRVGSDNDIKVLNEIYGELLTVKENPNLEKIIDLRNIFDKKINFEKTAREVSNSLDPLSRQVRSSIATEAANIVGKSEAANLTKYSEFMDAFSELKSYTDRRAGGEYLLRLVLSGRGGEARRLIQTIKDYTGIDLMDHAVMSTLATDLIGNASQKNLFRQEISKAGLDAYAAATGDPKGLLNFINNIGKGVLLDAEKTYLKAAQ